MDLAAGTSRSRSPYDAAVAGGFAMSATSSSSITPSVPGVDDPYRRQRGGSDASSSTLSKAAGASSGRKPSEASSAGRAAGSQLSAGRRKPRTEPPFAQRQPPTPPDSPGLLPPHLFASTSSSHLQQLASSTSQAPTGQAGQNSNGSRSQHLLPPFAGSSASGSTISPTRTRFSSELSDSSTAHGLNGSGIDLEKQNGLGLEGVEEEGTPTAPGPGGRRASWWANPIITPASFRGKFSGGSGSSSGTAVPHDGARSYFPSMLGGGGGGAGGSHTPTSLAEAPESGSPSQDGDLPLPASPSGYATPTRPRRATHRPNFRLSLPTPQPHPTYTEHHSRTPGWAEAYTPFASRRSGAHGRSLSRARGDHLSEKDFSSTQGDHSFRGGVKAKIARWTLYSFWTPLVLRLANFALTCTTLGLGVRIRNLESAAGLRGITGPSPLVAIIYSPPTLLHVLAAVYLEYFGKPIGLWSLPSKLLFTSLDLVVISLWASLLSLTMSDIFTSPLHCAPESSRWWTSVRSRDPTVAVGGVCEAQIAITVSVVVGVVGFLVGNVVSLARVWAKIQSRDAGGQRFGFGMKR